MESKYQDSFIPICFDKNFQYIHTLREILCTGACGDVDKRSMMIPVITIADDFSSHEISYREGDLLLDIPALVSHGLYYVEHKGVIQNPNGDPAALFDYGGWGGLADFRDYLLKHWSKLVRELPSLRSTPDLRFDVKSTMLDTYPKTAVFFTYDMLLAAHREEFSCTFVKHEPLAHELQVHVPDRKHHRHAMVDRNSGDVFPSARCMVWPHVFFKRYAEEYIQLALDDAVICNPIQDHVGMLCYPVSSMETVIVIWKDHQFHHFVFPAEKLLPALYLSVKSIFATSINRDIYAVTGCVAVGPSWKATESEK
jgi:hypothetical protein